MDRRATRQMSRDGFVEFEQSIFTRADRRGPQKLFVPL